ncbi:MAG: DNA-binding response regulator, partial [Paenibacillus sp.]|nr:DNA-binding response regulator [Paenibacillus sp.]
MFRIFIVEDDRRIVSLLEEHLHKFGYETRSVVNFEAVRDEFEQFTP